MAHWRSSSPSGLPAKGTIEKERRGNYQLGLLVKIIKLTIQTFPTIQTKDH